MFLSRVKKIKLNFKPLLKEVIWSITTSGMEKQILEPEILKNKRISDAIEQLLSNKSVSSDLEKELNSYKDETVLPFRVVKEIHYALSKSGDRKFI